jgi:MoaA/NifB/PqqE/SkfB family radical SAM enzyme
MNAPVNNIIWNMTRKCNFRCEYCYFPHDNTPVTQTLPVDRIRDFLDATGQSWTVGMTGGEPFIYPGFVDICAALTEGHMIGVDTNLSVSSKVRDFVRRIDPARVQDLYVALHIEERERIKGVPAFIENARLLLDAGFKVIVNYVVHPALENRFHEDVAFFAGHGIAITPRPFRGTHEGRRYPEAYGDRGREIFAGHPEQGAKVAFNFQGVPCSAGRTLLRLEPDGTVYRCPGDKTVLGNVMDAVRLLDGNPPCIKSRCPCRGLDHVSLTPAQQHLVDGVQLAVVGDSDASARAFGLALEAEPGHPCAENNLGVVVLRQGDAAAAMRHFAAAAEARPDKAAYRDNLDRARSAVSDSDPELCLDVNPLQVK